MIIYPGILSENIFVFLLSFLSAFTFTVLYGQTYQTFSVNYPNYIKAIKFCFGIRFLYIFLFPFLTLMNFLNLDYMLVFLSCVSGLYFFLALGYYYLCSIIIKN